jgi:hypothetical protein
MKNNRVSAALAAAAMATTEVYAKNHDEDRGAPAVAVISFKQGSPEHMQQIVLDAARTSSGNGLPLPSNTGLTLG